MKKTCAICGNPSGMYPLCASCFKLRDEGKIVKCEKCGTWHYSDKPCPNCAEQIKSDASKEKENKDFNQSLPEIKKNESIDNNEMLSKKCLICGNDSGEYLFCRSCYYKYKSKTLLLKVKNCSEIELLDESYEGIYVCKDGHVVKSKSERDIDNYLFLNEYFHAYERAVTIDGETFKPDFCLINVYPEEKGYKKNVYIEHWGYDETNTEYTKTKKYKLEKYEKAGITLVCTYEKSDAKDIDAALDRKLEYYEKGKLNYLE